jgi:hypothetical protein
MLVSTPKTKSLSRIRDAVLAGAPDVPLGRRADHGLLQIP